FFDGSTILGTATLSSGQATLALSNFSVGHHSITAQYSGGTNFNASASAPLDQAVNPAATLTTLTSSTNPSPYGQTVTFTATIAGGNSTTGAPTGSVNFFDGSTALGTATLLGGVANFSTTSLSTGSHTITAVYGGDANFTTSTSNPVTQTVSAPA